MAASEIRFQVPHPSSGLVLNLLGVLGLVAIVMAVGGLAGWLWALGVAGVFMISLCAVGWTHELAETTAAKPVEKSTAPPVAAVAAVTRSA